MLPTLFERFVKQSPVSVMLRGLMERIFIPHRLDRLFHDYAQLQYERELLFSSVVELMSLVVCSIYPSVYAAYRGQSSIVPVSASAFYEKLNGIEPQVTAALLRETATELANLLNELTGQATTWKGRLRVLDGNCLSSTDHRLQHLYRVDLLCDPEMQSFYSQFGMMTATGMMKRYYDNQSGAST